MKRRQFLQAAGVGLAATAVAKPAIAQSMPEIKWRLSSGFPKSLDTIYGGSEVIAKYVAEASDNRFQIQPFSAGEIVGTFQLADAVGNGTVEMGQTASYYYVGKDPTFAFPTAIPWGLNPRMENAWAYHGGGMDLMNEFYAKHGLYGMPAGNTGTQMGGWFRKELKTVADLQGLKFRIGGLGGQVLAKLGVVPQQIAGGDIYPALERGAIDSAEWVGPYDDEKLGFYKVAPHYYFPGWWESNSMYSFYVNIKEWEKLPKEYQAALEAASYEANIQMMAEYDFKNPAALQSLVKNGVKLHAYSPDIMKAAHKAAFELYEEEAAKNPSWKKIYEPWKKFRQDEFLWHRVAEQNLTTFLLNTPDPVPAKKK